VATLLAVHQDTIDRGYLEQQAEKEHVRDFLEKVKRLGEGRFPRRRTVK